MENMNYRDENHKILTWAGMSDTEFFWRYFNDATVQDVADFLTVFPEFMEDSEEKS